MKQLIKYCLSVTCLLFALQLGAQTGAVAELDSNIAETGNPFKMHLFVPQNLGEPSGIDFTPWDSLIPKQNILQQSGWHLQGNRWANDLSLIIFDADSNVMVPALPIVLKGGQSVLTNPLELTILSTPAPEDVADISGIKDIHNEPIAWSDYVPWIVGAVLLLLLGGLLYWYFSRRKKKEIISRSIELPPHTLALKKLEALQKKQLWQLGATKIYYAELTFILREYLQKRYQIPALESTSEETLRALRQDDEFPQDQIAAVTELLQQADLAKFAKAVPPESFHDAALFNTIRLVKETTPPEPTEPITNNPSTTTRS
ncbi:MAG: hypothetical protein WCR52_07540 [Bacteroidota bacterium]